MLLLWYYVWGFINIWIAVTAVTGILLSAVFLKLLGNKKVIRMLLFIKRAQDTMINATIEYVRGMPVVKAF